MPEKNAGKSVNFGLGQRILFRHRARPPLWLSGTIIGAPQSNQGQMLYQVKLDNGESRRAKPSQASES